MRLTGVRETDSNLFSFLSETGSGVQTYIDHDTTTGQNRLRVRCLPSPNALTLTKVCTREWFGLHVLVFVRVLYYFDSIWFEPHA